MLLNCHSYYSFKFGVMSQEQLLLEGVKQGATAIALTDINNTSGILDFFRLAVNHHIKPVAGIDFRNGVEQQFVGLAKNMNGFSELNRFLSGYLHSGSPIPSRPPVFENAFIILATTEITKRDIQPSTERTYSQMNVRTYR